MRVVWCGLRSGACEVLGWCPLDGSGRDEVLVLEGIPAFKFTTRMRTTCASRQPIAYLIVLRSHPPRVRSPASGVPCLSLHDARLSRQVSVNPNLEWQSGGLG